MAKPDKAAAVAELESRFRNSGGAVLTDYRGLSVKQLQELRRSLGEDAEYAVVKNRLTKVALAQSGVEGLDEMLVGPSAIAFINGDPVKVAKSLRDFAKTNPELEIKGGLLDGKVLEVDDLKKLADLESREVLLSMLAGALQASLSKAAALFQAPLSDAARLVEALRAKVESGAESTEANDDESATE